MPKERLVTVNLPRLVGAATRYSKLAIERYLETLVQDLRSLDVSQSLLDRSNTNIQDPFLIAASIGTRKGAILRTPPSPKPPH